jgi:hypothetical protein
LCIFRKLEYQILLEKDWNEKDSSDNNFGAFSTYFCPQSGENQ